MRNLHRWISTVGMVFWTYLVISGTVLAFQEILGPRVFESLAAPTPTLATADIERLVTTAAHAAMAHMGNAPLKAIRVQLRMNGDHPQATVTLVGSDAQTLLLNAATGEQLAPPPANSARGPRPGGARSLNATLQVLHSGEIAGVAGQWLMIATGIMLIVMSFTGIWMYFQMLNLRWKRGRKDWFWR